MSRYFWKLDVRGAQTNSKCSLVESVTKKCKRCQKVRQYSRFENEWCSFEPIFSHFIYVSCVRVYVCEYVLWLFGMENMIVVSGRLVFLMDAFVCEREGRCKNIFKIAICSVWCYVIFVVFVEDRSSDFRMNMWNYAESRIVKRNRKLKILKLL